LTWIGGTDVFVGAAFWACRKPAQHADRISVRASPRASDGIRARFGSSIVRYTNPPCDLWRIP